MKYLAVPDDEIDKLLAEFIKFNNKLEVEFQRLSPGQYLFGTRKITCKVLNDKLMVRIGGGYTSIEEFVISYGEKEL